MKLRIHKLEVKTLINSHVCPNFNWTIQDHNFKLPVRLTKLGGYHMVLGCDWMRRVSPVEFDFENRRFGYTVNKTEIVIDALTLLSECKLITGKELH